MPCTDGGVPYASSQPANTDGQTIRKLRKEKNRIEAYLCAALTFIESLPHSRGLREFANSTDWMETGVNFEEIDSWWESHKKQDIARKAKQIEQAKIKAEQDKQKADKANKLKIALSKLTDEDRSVLGL